jgi:hypothetical protein
LIEVIHCLPELSTTGQQKHAETTPNSFPKFDRFI